MLAADIPDFQVNGRIGRREGYGSDILADSGDGLEVGMRGSVGALDLFEEGGLAGVVKA